MRRRALIAAFLALALGSLHLLMRLRPGTEEVIADGGGVAVPLPTSEPTGRGVSEWVRRLAREPTSPRADAQRDQEARRRHIADLRKEIASALGRQDPWVSEEWRTSTATLGRALLENGQVGESLGAYWQLLATSAADDPRSRRHRAGFGLAAVLLGRRDDALDALREADSENSYAGLCVLGWLLEGRADLAGALAAYERATLRHAARPEAWLRGASVLVRQGREIEARRWLEQAEQHTRDLPRAIGGDPELAPLLALRASARLHPSP